MTRTWLPQADAIPIGGNQYRPVYRWYREADYAVVPRSQPYPSRTAAREAAEDYLAAAMNNGATKAQNASTGLADAIAGNVIAWRQTKAVQQEEDAKVFGNTPAGIIRDKGGREIRVEQRHRRRA